MDVLHLPQKLSPRLYEILYNDLKYELNKNKVFILDFVYLRKNAWVIEVGDYDFLTFINHKFSWKRKLFALAHEAGHWFRFEKGKFIKSKFAGEKIANARAINVLKFFRVKKTKEEYMKFYEKFKIKKI